MPWFSQLTLLCKPKGRGWVIHEGGIRSSLIVWGRGFIDKDMEGTLNKESVFSAIDFAPSLLKLAGSKKLSANKLTDGEDVSMTILGKSRGSRQAPIFYSRPPDRKSYYGIENLPDLAVRDGEWKLLCDYEGTRPELYNIVEDPGETKNLTEQKPELTQNLIEKVTSWYASMPQL